jgi:ABC-2 type transport system permease protein
MTATGTTTRTLRFTAHDLRRLVNDRAMLFFSMGLPVVLYLVFGAAMGYGDETIGTGDVRAYVMIGMGLYAGITGAVAAAGTVVIEADTGWGRQLALTPLTAGQQLFSNVVAILVRAALPVAAVFVVGAVTGASMPGYAWALSLLLAVVVAVPFGFYGMVWTQLSPTQTSVSIASTSVVVLAFLGNMFMPMPEGLFAVGRFTPLYGAGALARWPLTGGEQSVSYGDGTVTDPLWWAVVNTVVWAAVFVVVVLALRRREKGRR